jgi:hypothetical protein
MPREKISPSLHYELCRRFWSPRNPDTGKPWTAGDLARWLTEEEGRPTTREGIFPLLRKGVREGYLRLSPPVDPGLARKISLRYPRAPGDIRVVNVQERGENDECVSDGLARASAECILEQIVALGKLKPKGGRVHMALGAGDTTRRVAERLALLLEREHDLPPLTLHALSSGFAARQPQSAPLAFFSYFSRVQPDVEYVGLFSQPMVVWSEYREFKKSVVVHEAFQEARKIDIVVTSLAQADDEHGMLSEFLRMYRGEASALREAGHVGDIQWQPYSKERPLSVDTGVRAVTLFDLPGLVRLASRHDKRVILVAGPCHGCGRTKDKALRPILTQPSLRACTHLVTDTRTARAVLD